MDGISLGGTLGTAESFDGIELGVVDVDGGRLGANEGDWLGANEGIRDGARDGDSLGSMLGC